MAVLKTLYCLPWTLNFRILALQIFCGRKVFVVLSNATCRVTANTTVHAQGTLHACAHPITRAYPLAAMDILDLRAARL